MDSFAIVFAQAYRFLGSISNLAAVMLKQQVPIFAVKIDMQNYLLQMI